MPFQLNQVVYQADGEWMSGRPIEGDFDVHEDCEGAEADARYWLASHTPREVAQVKSLVVRTMIVDSLDDSASDGIGSMHSDGIASTIV